MDANDTRRFAEARSELDSLMKEVKLEKIPVLVLASKSDVLGAKDVGQV